MTTSTKIPTAQLASGLASIGQRQYHPLLSKLQRPDLVRAQGFIGGEWVEAHGNGHFTIDAKLLKEWATAIISNSEDLAVIGSIECGKPLAEAKWEVEFAAGVIEYFAHEVVRSSGSLVCPRDPSQKILVTKEPVGVVGIVTPWNFPYAILGLRLGPALAAGCAVVVKPAGETPLSMLALAALAEEVGLPPGVLNVVTAPRERSEEVGRVLTSSTEVRKLSFAGSTHVGKWLMQQSSTTLKRLSLVLGGNAAFIVFEDADLDKAVDGLIRSKFANTGQACIASNRVLVHASVYEAFTAKVVARVKHLKMGLPLDEAVQLGPLIGPSAVKRVAELVDDAVAHGAKVLLGGRASDLGGNFYEATVLSDVTENMRVWREEAFGPVVSLSAFVSEEEAVQKANDTAVGLAGYFYTRDVARVFRVASELECGMVGANSEVVTHVGAPYGGVKESGLGIEGSPEDLQEYQETKMVCIGGLDFRRLQLCCCWESPPSSSCWSRTPPSPTKATRTFLVARFSPSAALLLLGVASFQFVLAEDPAFSYKSDSDALSPSQWVQGYPACGGSKQSPIDITESMLCSAYVPPPVSFKGSCPHYNLTETKKSYKAAVNGGAWLRGSYSELIRAYVDKGHVFHYAGSLTTPPCTEFVDWWVVRTPVLISSAQFDRINANLAELEITDHGKNARSMQPLNGRAVTTYN
ncbi:unnamed protein product [Phytophthora fragariaefolia]|uniref:Succinate-semialdehyde dehydrogenase, mitochondrial n=1 Tax=Phytophthora fragariaefolia TaxID=1490495 RepID=A0A9W6XKE8_9STRA|nr:unnamed protein product [Phytophthora fragariaefolia]